MNAYWSLPREGFFQAIDAREEGLSSVEAAQRLLNYGRNSLDTNSRVDNLRLFLRQFASPLVLILVFAATVSMFVQDWTDAAIITTIILASGLTSFFQEYAATHSVAKLRERLAHWVTVLRDGMEPQVNANATVPGDVVLLRAGALVPADGVMLNTKNLLVS